MRGTHKLVTTALLGLACALFAAAPATAKRRAERTSQRTSTHGRRRGHLARRHHPRLDPQHVKHVKVKAPKDPGPEESASAAIAGVLATPCENTELTPDAEDLPLARAAVLCLVNRERAEHGVSPLTANPKLEEAAEGHCQELIADDYFAHVSPSGETPVDRIAQTGYVPGPSAGYVIGENLAWGTYDLATPQAIVSAWIASPGHLANILEAQYRDTGIGVTPAVPQSLGEGNPGATYAQEFGVIVR